MNKREKPKNKWGKLDKARVQELYMTSPFLEWTKFAESQGWNPYRSRTDFPVSLWQDEKRRLLAQNTAEEIKNAVFKIRGEYHLEVIETLSSYPKLIEDVRDLVQTRIDAIKKMSFSQREAIPTRELLNLTKAADAVTAAKHRSLMLDRVRWLPDIAEAEAKALEAPAKTSKETQDTSWRLEVIGSENLTTDQMKEFLASWYDKPSSSGSSSGKIFASEGRNDV